MNGIPNSKCDRKKNKNGGQMTNEPIISDTKKWEITQQHTN